MSRVCSSCEASYAAVDLAFCDACGAITFEPQSTAAPDPRVGKLLGEHVVVARIADGAMGRVYEARHAVTNARVAIKLLHAHIESDPVSVERFRREHETTDMLAHPNIVRMLGLERTKEGAHYLVMEHLRGEDLGNLLQREGALRPARLIRLACQTALALEYAHSFGVIHRDLKPANIFLCGSPEGDEVRLLDFGSVKLQVETGQKLTALGTTLGSPYYMSPEQAMGKLDVDHRTDVFAMAAILHECATGKVTFYGPKLEEILRRIVQFVPPPPSSFNAAFPRSFDDAIMRGLQKAKTSRTPNARALASGVLSAFGLTQHVARWAYTSVDAIEAALASAERTSSDPA